MPNFGTHTFAGATVALLFSLFMMDLSNGSYLNNLQVALTNFIGISVFSMVPDVDQPGSHPRQLFLTFAFGAIALLAYLEKFKFIIAICILFIILNHFTKHRGFMHSYLFGIIIAAPFIVYNWMFAIAAFISFCSHIWLDQIFTKRRSNHG